MLPSPAGTTAYFGYLEKREEMVAQQIETERSSEAERYKVAIQHRGASCAGALTYLGDETPNPSLSVQLRSQTEALVLEGLRNCSLALPSPSGSDAVVEPKLKETQR